MQSKKNSIIESVTNTVIGLVASFIIQIIIYPLLNISVNINQNIIITFVFFAASVLRGYLIRRYFNKKNMKQEQIEHFNKIIALFLTMEEESTYLIGQLKRENKMIFNRWRKEMMKIVKIVEKDSDNDYLDSLKDKLHEALK